MARRIREHHARMRLVQRTSVASFDKLRRAVKERRFTHLRRQTCTRSLCLAVVDGEKIYFVLNRQRGTIVTVLTEAQALSWMSDNERQASGSHQGDHADKQD